MPGYPKDRHGSREASTGGRGALCLVLTRDVGTGQPRHRRLLWQHSRGYRGQTVPGMGELPQSGEALSCWPGDLPPLCRTPACASIPGPPGPSCCGGRAWATFVGLAPERVAEGPARPVAGAKVLQSRVARGVHGAQALGARTTPHSPTCPPHMGAEHLPSGVGQGLSWEGVLKEGPREPGKGCRGFWKNHGVCTHLPGSPLARNGTVRPQACWEASGSYVRIHQHCWC